MKSPGEITLISLDVLGVTFGQALLLFPAQPQREGFGDSLGDRVLHREHIRKFLIERAGPENQNSSATLISRVVTRIRLPDFCAVPSRIELTRKARPMVTGSCFPSPYFRTEFSEDTMISRLLLSFVIKVSAMPASKTSSRLAATKGLNGNTAMLFSGMAIIAVSACCRPEINSLCQPRLRSAGQVQARLVLRFCGDEALLPPIRGNCGA